MPRLVQTDAEEAQLMGGRRKSRGVQPCGRFRLPLVAVWIVLLPLLATAHSDSAVAAARIQITHVDAGAYPRLSFQLHVTDPSGVPPASIGSANVEVRDGTRVVSHVDKQLMRADRRGTDILLLIDTGISSRGATVDGTRSVSGAFVPGLQAPDRASISLFAEHVNQLTPFTGDKSALTAAMAHFQNAAGSSHIYDSLWTAVNGLNDASQRYAVILVTDGGDVHSKRSLQSGIALAHSRHIPVYCVALGNTPDLGVLHRISDGTGGMLFSASTSDELSSVYRRLALVFRHDYLLSFSAPVVYHRGNHVRLQVTYRPVGSKPATEHVDYVVPSAPWVHIQVEKPSLGTIEDPRHISLPVTFSSEDTVAHRLTIADSGWPGISVQPAVVTVPPYASGALHLSLTLGTQAAYPGGLSGQLSLRAHPLDAGVQVAGAEHHLPFRVLASTIRIQDLPSDLHDVTDFDRGHTVPFSVYSTVYRASTVRVSIDGAPGATVSPRVLHLPPATQQAEQKEQVAVTIPGAPVGQHGRVRLHFTALTRGVSLRNGNSTLVYYVPTWWENNWKWFVPTVLLLLFLVYAALQLTRDAVTTKWDDVRRSAMRRYSTP